MTGGMQVFYIFMCDEKCCLFSEKKKSNKNKKNHKTDKGLLKI